MSKNPYETPKGLEKPIAIRGRDLLLLGLGLLVATSGSLLLAWLAIVSTRLVHLPFFPPLGAVARFAVSGIAGVLIFGGSSLVRFSRRKRFASVTLENRRKLEAFDVLVYILVPTIWILTALDTYWHWPSTLREIVRVAVPLFCSACVVFVWWDRRKHAARLAAEKTPRP